MDWTKLIKKVKDYSTLVMFSHTIFSLSFAIISMLLASNGLPSFRIVFWIILAFLSARTGANALNRVIDAEIDAKNPRTANRQLPQGLLEKKEVILLSFICFVIMLISATRLNILSLILSPIALFLMIVYSYTKRFTFLCHLVLGITCAAAPVGAWIAVTGEMSWIAFFMGAANTAWVAGFDTIYATQDYQFDTENGIHSIPAFFGVKYGLYIAALLHIASIIFLVIVGLLSEAMNMIYFIGISVVALLFIVQHVLISPTNLEKVKVASYNVNQLVSVTFLVFAIIDVML